eukprot:1356827-Amphidinium_carterae.2
MKAKQELTRRHSGMKMTPTSLQKLSNDWCSGVIPPGESERAAFERCAIQAEAKHPLQGWLRHLAILRESHTNIVLELRTETGSSYVKFVFAMQRPFSVWFQRLDCLQDSAALLPEQTAGMQEEQRSWASVFSYTEANIVSGSEYLGVASSSVFVYAQCWYLSPGVIVSDSGALPWQYWVRADQFLQEHPPDEETPERESASIDENNMWVQEYLSSIDGRLASADSDIAELTDAETRAVMPESLSIEEVLGRAYAALQTQQRRVVQHHRSSSDFKVSAVGGSSSSTSASTAARKGFQGFARTAVAKHFCALGSLSQSATYTDAMYSSRVAYVMSHEWCDRMQALLDSYTGKGIVWEEFLADPIPHEPSDEYMKCLASLRGKPLERADAIKDLGPAMWVAKC